MEYTYTLIRSRRKTISLELKNGALIVRAPNRTAKKEADAFVRKHAAWIENQKQKLAAREKEAAAVQPLSEAELHQLYERAAAVIPARVADYADKLGLRYGRITLRCQKTRWGSCSAKKNLNFNVLLMLTPPEVIDSVAAHEVCHLAEMNHSPRFYELVLSVCPDYRRWDKWLKEHGGAIMARVHR